jgi:hypothetical protein
MKEDFYLDNEIVLEESDFCKTVARIAPEMMVEIAMETENGEEHFVFLTMETFKKLNHFIDQKMLNSLHDMLHGPKEDSNGQE